MVTVIAENTKQRNESRENKYNLFKDLFYNTDFSRDEILKQLDMSVNSRSYKDIRERWLLEEEVTPQQRAKRIRDGSWI